MKKILMSLAAIVFLLVSQVTPAQAVAVFSAKPTNSAKPLPLPEMRDVLIFNASVVLVDGVQRKLFKGNSFSVQVKAGKSIQIVITDLWPNLVAAPVLIHPKGISVNLSPLVPDLDGNIQLPYLIFKTKGSYSILTRQPDEPKLNYIKIKVT